MGPNTANGLIGSELLHAKNLTIVIPAWVDGQTNYAVFESVIPTSRVWLDHCSIQNVNLDRHAHVAPLINGADKFITDTVYNEVDGGPYAAILARNDRIQGMINGAYSNSQLVINCAVNNVEFYGSYHPDVYQMYAPGAVIDNYIIYGLRATNCDSQGLNITTPNAIASVNNMAIVNFVMQKTGTSSMSNQLSGGYHHFLVWDSTILQGVTWYGASDFANVSFKNSVFQGFFWNDWNTRDTAIAAIQAAFAPGSSQNHFVQPLVNGPFPVGSSYTSGDPMLQDPAHGNFKPMTGSPLQGRVFVPPVPIDAAGIAVPTPGSLGAYQP
jgi:hypothetical protein